MWIRQGGACSSHGKYKKYCIKISVGKHERKRELGRRRVDERIILQHILMKYVVRM
jgi:hypothetical protein